MEDFRIPCLDVFGENIFYRTVEGERIEICGLDCFVFDESTSDLFPTWNVSALTTGLSIATGATKRKAINEARKRLSSRPIAVTLEAAKRVCKDYGVKLPVNE